MESAESTQEMGPSPEPLAVCSCDCEQQQQLSALWALAKAFLEAQLVHLGERVA